MSETGLLFLSRERFQAAVEILGTGDAQAVADESIERARVLSAEAQSLLTRLLEIRLRAIR